MNWKCKLGFHDWEQIDYKSHSDIRNTIIREITQDKYTLSTELFPDTYYEDKVCLRCSKREDDITPHKEQVYAQELTKGNRIKLRKELLKKLTYLA